MNNSCLFKNEYDLDIHNQKRLNQLIDNLVTDYSKLLVIRLDFYIKKDFPVDITPKFMTDTFTRLRNNMRNNKLFEHYITYARKLEYGQDRKWHFHILFFFDGQKVNHDIWFSQQIGEYWVNILTRGIGQYHSCNMKQDEYTYNGIGIVHYSDHEKIAYLKQSASYLTKEDPNIAEGHYLDASGRNIRTFEMGHYTPREHNSGRPRNKK